MTAPAKPPVTVPGVELRQVLSAAMCLTTRTASTQRAMAVVAEAIDASTGYPDGCWAGMVSASWTHVPCARCGRVLSLEDDLAGCAGCASGTLRDPLCEVTQRDHLCTNAAGEPLRLGQACWPSARMQGRRA